MVAQGEKRLTFAYTFEEPFPKEPVLKIGTILLDGQDISYDVFHITPYLDESRFLSEIISLTPLLGTVQVTWTVAYQGPCQSHTHCPTTQYCDRYLGCDDCSVCVTLQDTFDGSPCPAKCDPYWSVYQPQQHSTSPSAQTSATATAAAATPSLTTASSVSTAAGASGSGQRPLFATNDTNTRTTTTTPTTASNGDVSAAASTAAPLPAPCVVCEVETYPCGEECLIVSGLDLPECFEPAGCAVTHGQGSLGHLNGSSVLGLTTEQVATSKAAGALEKLTSINPHLASPTLKETIDFIESTALCTDVVCEAPSQCHEEPECVDGQCQPALPKEQGTPCDDGIEATDDDACDGAGACVGIDYCAGVTCPPPTQCHVEGTCSHGVCTDVLAPEGTLCDDGLEHTDFDSCSSDGVCAGVDLCEGITCPAPTQCHVEGTCSHGVCTDEYKPQGTACDDGIEATDDDACDGAGACVGIDYCDTVQCTPSSACQQNATCFRGQCFFDFLPDGTEVCRCS